MKKLIKEPEYGAQFTLKTRNKQKTVTYIGKSLNVAQFEAENGEIHELTKWEFYEKLEEGTLQPA